MIKRSLWIVSIILILAGVMAMSFDNRSFHYENELEESIKRGKDVYMNTCLTCHMENGEGITGVFPPLAKSDYLMEDTKRSIRVLIYGANSEMEVNGTIYNGSMDATGLNDQEISDVLNYIRNSWGNKGGIVRPEDVGQERE
ncbi:cytochrome c [Fulvivirgaceae bacterium BMA10]|uniref:Cytochrome c n=1 Tax=Splendidivirga corallicola TaxID=3051826 RepID=A0ABT8KQK9_9BACT|nr:cytochrome c [Fulvivirgaceae bacterium BMA10]